MGEQGKNETKGKPKRQEDTATRNTAPDYEGKTRSILVSLHVLGHGDARTGKETQKRGRGRERERKEGTAGSLKQHTTDMREREVLSSHILI